MEVPAGNLDTSSGNLNKDYLANLNPEQLKAATHFTGPMLVLAGAGSGKTRVITRRVANLVLEHKIHPSKILAVTFTNKATQEMRERLANLLGERAKDLWISTFHAAALKILRRHAPKLGFTHDFVVYDDQDSKSLIKRVVKNLKLDDKKNPPDKFARIIDAAKNNYKSPQDLAEESVGYQGKINAEVYDLYQRELFTAQAMDFGDLIFLALKLFKEHEDVRKIYQNSLRFIMVDEFQDTNMVQYEFIRLIVGAEKNLLVVGDDDQSIYRFRGATIENILNFEKDFPQTSLVKLEQNYRSTKNILTAAHGVIEKNKERKAKKLWTAGEAGQGVNTYVGSDELDEAEFVAREIAQLVKTENYAYKDFAIFYRTNAQSRALEEALTFAKIPYRIFGGLKFYDRKEIKDLLSYLKLIANPKDTQAFLRVVNVPARGIGAQAVELVNSNAQSSGCSLYEAAQNLASSHKGLTKFTGLFSEFIKAANKLSVDELLRLVIEKTGYGEIFKQSKDPQDQSRLENINELVAVAARSVDPLKEAKETLREFLDTVALTAGNDLPQEQEVSNIDQPASFVSLMTVHLAKGLEFPVVFLTGFEEGLMPHYRSIEEGNIDEERRLSYVGLTRAMQRLYLTRVEFRGMFSSGGGFAISARSRELSRFSYDIPSECFSAGYKKFLDQYSEEEFVEDTEDKNQVQKFTRVAPESNQLDVDTPAPQAFDSDSSAWAGSRIKPKENKKTTISAADKLKKAWQLIKTADQLE